MSNETNSLSQMQQVITEWAVKDPAAAAAAVQSSNLPAELQASLLEITQKANTPNN